MEVKTNIDPVRLAKAMQEMNTAGIDPKDLPTARYEHFLRVMVHACDPYQRAAVLENFRQQLAKAREKISKQNRPKLII